MPSSRNSIKKTNVPSNKKKQSVNRTKPDRWKADIVQSVDMYNEWFMKFAPSAYRKTRIKTTKDVESTLAKTANLTDVSPTLFAARIRCTANPADVNVSATCGGSIDWPRRRVEESGRMYGRGEVSAAHEPVALENDLTKIGTIIERLADPDIFVWLGRGVAPTEPEIHRAATIVADRLCGAIANPIIRNAQEQRQLAAIGTWLKARGYQPLPPKTKFDAMPPGTFSFRLNVPVKLEGLTTTINIPVNVVAMPKSAKAGNLPLLIEAKSAGDYTNVNKRRKEEAVKMSQLRVTYGTRVRFILFLCGYFDSGYLGYEAAEGIDWVWEHRIDELAEFGL